MKKLAFLLCLVMLFSCLSLTFVSCDEETNVETEEAETATQAPTVILETDEPSIGDMLYIQSMQSSDDPVLSVMWEYTDFDFETYKDLKLGFYYKDRLLAECDMGTASSFVTKEVCYGKVNVRVTAQHAEKGVIVLKSGDVGVFAPEYNIASMNGSMPVLYFSLDLFSRKEGITQNNYASQSLPVMADVPTFISLERANSYDWNALPDNVYRIPSIPQPTGNFHGNNDLVAAYIRELYEINPNSHFNFYCVDNYPELILKFFVAQGIDNYHTTLVSDGTGSAYFYQEMTKPAPENGANADEVFAKMAAEWVRIKTAAANGASDYLEDVFMGRYPAEILARYAFVIATLEDNVEWWCARESLFRDNANSQYITDLLYGTNESGKNAEGLKTNIIYPAFNKMFAGLSTVDALALKQMYKFSTDVFSVAGEKEVLMVLGTSTAAEGDLENYIKMLQAEYGDTHMIFYKGHPGWPTALDANKQAMLDRLGVVDVESYIAAEIILFYCPDIYLAGFDTSTFYSAQDDRILAVFITEEVGLTKTYESKTYFNPVSAYGSTYAQYEGCYVIEYADSARVDIYNPVTGTFTTVTPAE